jgi:hypothetical protein
MNNIDMNEAGFKEIREALSKRGQYKRFLSDVDRHKLIEILYQRQYGWLEYERGYEAMGMFGETIFGYECCTDKDIIDECKEYLEDEEDEDGNIEIDEDSCPDVIFVANIVARCELEEAIFEGS